MLKLSVKGGEIFNLEKKEEENKMAGIGKIGEIPLSTTACVIHMVTSVIILK